MDCAKELGFYLGDIGELMGAFKHEDDIGVLKRPLGKLSGSWPGRETDIMAPWWKPTTVI